MVKCRIGTKELEFRTMNEFYNYENFNDITSIDEFKHKIIKIRKYPTSLKSFSFRKQKATNLTIFSESETIMPPSFRKIIYSYCCIYEFPEIPHNIEEFICDRNQICSINKHIMFLKILDCSYNFIKRVNIISKSLVILNCVGNYIKNFENLPETLEELDCSHNLLTELINLPESLLKLTCTNNKIANIIIPKNLKYLDCAYNEITILDELPDSLKKIRCHYNLLTTIIFPKNLTYLRCNKNKIKRLGKMPTSLIYLNCSCNKIDKIEELSNNIVVLDCSKNCICDLGELPSKLEILLCYKNKIKQFSDIPNKLKILNCEINEITKIDKLPDTLIGLNCCYNKINEIDIVKLNNLIRFECKNNKIEYITLPLNINTLICDENVKLYNVPDLLKKMNEHNFDNIYDMFMVGKICNNDILNKLHINYDKIDEKINEKNECLICHLNTKCIHLPCNDEHMYCLMCFVKWYCNNKNKLKCCICFKDFFIADSIYY
jgi:hypothetical protein